MIHCQLLRTACIPCNIHEETSHCSRAVTNSRLPGDLGLKPCYFRTPKSSLTDTFVLSPQTCCYQVVLDVGTGSGILAIWAAQAGAKKVYAVEATDMAVHARQLAQANGVADRVEVIQGSVEEVTLPEEGKECE